MAKPYGLLLVGFDYSNAAEDEFNAWYNEEHIPRLREVPGCLCARRFMMVGGTHRYLAVYHFSTPAVPASEAWKEAAGTPWTAKLRPHFKDPLRLVLRRYVRNS